MNPIIRIVYSEILQARGDTNAVGLPSLIAAVGNIPHEQEFQIVGYLNNAPNSGARGSFARDFFRQDDTTIYLPYGNNTDGKYIWPTELAYYVQKYHVRLPEKFVQHMASRNWTPPDEKSFNYSEFWERLRAESDSHV